MRLNEWKMLVTVYSDGRPEWVAKIEAADTMTGLQRRFIEIVDAAHAASIAGHGGGRK